MPICGSFETEQELHHGVLSVVYVARPRGGGKPCALTLLQPSPLQDEQVRSEQIREFLDRAKVQKAVTDGGAQHWAPVHEFGAVGEAAYCAIDLYETSVVTLVTGVQISAPRLFNVVRSVVAGLRELEAAAGRPHGNLKPSNVLIAEVTDLASARVVLTDPLPKSQVRPSEHRQADLRAVGELIFQLVLHQPVPSGRGLVIGEQPQWTALGPRGDDWRRLCNRLLDPVGAVAITELDNLAEEVEQLRPVRGKLPAWAYVAAAVPLLAAGVLFFAPWNGSEPVPVPPNGLNGDVEAMLDELCRASVVWLPVIRGLDAASIGPESPFAVFGRAVALAQGASGGEDLLDLAVVFKDHTSEDSARMICRDDALRQAARSDAALNARVRAAHERLQELRGELERSFLAVRDRATTYRGYEWKGPAELLDARAKAGEAILEADRLSRDAGDELVASVADALSVADVFDEAMVRLHDSGDAFLVGFTLHCAGRLDAAMRRSELRQALARVRTERDDMIECLRTLRDQIDEDLFRDEQRELYAKADQPGYVPDEVDLAQWRDALRRPDAENRGLLYAKLPPEQDPTRDWDPQRWLVEIDDLAQKIQGQPKPLPDELSPGDDVARARVLVKQAEELIAMPLSRKTRPEKERRRREIHGELVALRDQYRDIWEQWNTDYEAARAERLREIDPPESVTRYAYHGLNMAYVEAIRQNDRIHRDDPAAFYQAANAVTEWLGQRERNLRENGDGRPLAEALIDAPFDAAAVVQVEQARVTSLVERTLQGVASPDEFETDSTRRLAWEDGVQKLRDWRAEVGRLATDYARIDALLRQGYRSDEPTPDGLSIAALRATWRDSQVAEDLADVLAGLEQRLAELESVESMRELDPLLRALDDPRPAIRLAAWRRLERWADEAAALERERQVSARLEAALAEIPGEERRAALWAEVANGLRDRWIEHFRASGAEVDDDARRQRLDAALAAMDEFGVTENALAAQPATLAASIRYDRAVYQLRQAVAAAPEMSDDEASRLIEEFVQEATPWLDDLPAAERPVVRAWLETLAGVARGEISTTRPEDVGPGRPDLPEALRWTLGDRDEALAWLEFQWGRHALTFVQVPIDDEQSVYVCAQEMSLELFADVIQAAGAWDAAAEFMDPYRDRGDLRRGPRVWQWTTARMRGLEPAETWYEASRQWPNENPNALFQGTAPPPGPLATHPVQYLSPHAAALVATLMGCRLPTEVEWQRALAQSVDVPAGGDVEAALERRLATTGVNLRDATWAAQRDRVKELTFRDLRYPDEQAYMTTDITARGAEAPSWGDRGVSPADGMLFFFSTNEPESPRGEFRHLVGNVAEYVAGTAAPLESVPAGRADAAAVSAALAEAGCGVIGGSALSPPELPPARASWLTLNPAGPDSIRRRGNADVGFRLAFPATGLAQSRVASLQQMLETPVYVVAR